MSKRIDSISIIHDTDCDSGISDLGEYTDDCENGVIVCKFGKFWEQLTQEELDNVPNKGREFRCFRPANSSEEPIGSEDYCKYGLQDYQRVRDLDRGEWCYLGVYATAQIVVGDTVQTIKSPGLWGVESDSGEDYLKLVADEELAALRRILLDLGFTESEIDAAIAAGVKAS